MEKATPKLTFLGALCVVAFYESFFTMPMAEAKAISQEISCSNDGECTRGGQKQAVLGAISSSATYLRWRQ
ncbi:hypothetical protein WN943_020129 [Citrus x changshan-huyou]